MSQLLELVAIVISFNAGVTLPCLDDSVAAVVCCGCAFFAGYFLPVCLNRWLRGDPIGAPAKIALWTLTGFVVGLCKRIDPSECVH